MGKKNPKPSDRDISPFPPLLLVVVAGSGCAALIYEIVWYQLLQLLIGSTAASLGVLLATFMGGLCLGSIVLPRIAAARSIHPLRVYAVLELGIGICGIFLLFGAPFVNRMYVALMGQNLSTIMLRGLICAACLLLPTILMGASLPAIAGSARETPGRVTWLGYLYAANTLGSIFGCLLAGFYLLRVFGMATATYVAVALNGGATLGSFVLSTKVLPLLAAGDSFPEQPAALTRHSSAIYASIALSGASALGAEVVWTRLLGLMLGPTVYTFSIILAVLLAGLAIGSGAGARLSRVVRAETALGYCQLLLALSIAWTAFALAKWIPYWSFDPMVSGNSWSTFQMDAVRTFSAIFPATLLWGASFPLALAAIAQKRSQGNSHANNDAGALIGTVYAANTAGAIVGALAFSMILIPWVGTQQSERILVALTVASALCVFVPLVRQSRVKKGSLLLASVTLAAGLLLLSVPGMPPEVIAYGRLFKIWADDPSGARTLYAGEGLNSSIAITEMPDGVVRFHVSGKTEASTERSDMRLQRMLGDMAALLSPNPRSVLVVGFGAGVTAGSFVPNPDVQRLVICEIEPLIPRVAAQYFSKENYDVLNDKRTEVVYDDARHYVLTTNQKFDVITSDPIHPWVKGSATLYSKEYFELVKAHLNAGGIVTQWVPLYQSDLATVKSEIGTFFQVFPNGTIWSNEVAGEGYDIVLLGQAEPMEIHIGQLQQRLDFPAYAGVAKSLRDVGFNSAVDLLATYAGQGLDLEPWLRNAEINRDENLRLQYLAGMALNAKQEQLIYDEMMRYRKFPTNLIVGSDPYLARLRDKLPLVRYSLSSNPPDATGTPAMSVVAPHADDGIVIKESDVRELAAFQNMMTGHSKSRTEIIHDLANQWIVRGAADESKYPQPTQEAVDNALVQLVKQLPSPAEFKNRCVAAGIDETEVRRMLQRQLYMSGFLDYRFRAVSDVSEQQVASFYREEFVPQITSRGEPVPPLRDVAGTIHETLVRRAVNVRSSQWLDQTRDRLKIMVVPDSQAE